jgi:hypothetical protein
MPAGDELHAPLLGGGGGGRGPDQPDELPSLASFYTIHNHAASNNSPASATLSPASGVGGHQSQPQWGELADDEARWPPPCVAPSANAGLETLDYEPVANEVVAEETRWRFASLEGRRKHFYGYTGLTFAKYVLTLLVGKEGGEPRLCTPPLPRESGRVCIMINTIGFYCEFKNARGWLLTLLGKHQWCGPDAAVESVHVRVHN